MTRTHREVYYFLNVKALPGKEDLQIMKTKLTRKGSQKTSAELARLAPVPSHPAPDLFLRAGDESWPRLQNIAAQNGRPAPRQYR